MEKIAQLAPWIGTLFASLFSWGMTALGAATVFLTRKDRMRGSDSLMAVGAGIMTASSIWSLLIPSLEQSRSLLMPTLGVLLGGAMIQAVEYCLDISDLLYRKASHKRSFLLVAAVTLHNIPEGMAIGLAFSAEKGAAPWLLALGIALQNFPEGAAVSLTLRREGFSRQKSFFCGQASGMVEPLAALCAYFLSVNLENALPFLLAFSAGAMLAVVAGELLPEAAAHSKQQTISGFLLGFLLMMVLDVALG